MNLLIHHAHMLAVTFAIATALSVTACDNETARAEQRSPAQPKAESVASSSPTQSADREKLAALDSYERIRASLAKDAISATTADAAALERSARAVAKADSARAEGWTSLADATKELHAMSKNDADAVRMSFGEVSKYMVSVLSHDAETAKDLHVFECPMAQGYKKWVQPAETVSNPYMGTRMPECGSKSSF